MVVYSSNFMGPLIKQASQLSMVHSLWLQIIRIIKSPSHTKTDVTNLAAACICSLYVFLYSYCLLIHGNLNVDMQRWPSKVCLFAVFTHKIVVKSSHLFLCAPSLYTLFGFTYHLNLFQSKHRLFQQKKTDGSVICK